MRRPRVRDSHAGGGREGEGRGESKTFEAKRKKGGGRNDAEPDHVVFPLLLSLLVTICATQKIDNARRRPAGQEREGSDGALRTHLAFAASMTPSNLTSDERTVSSCSEKAAESLRDFSSAMFESISHLGSRLRW